MLVTQECDFDLGNGFKREGQTVRCFMSSNQYINDKNMFGWSAVVFSERQMRDIIISNMFSFG